MALPTAEEIIGQFMDACTSDKATARTLEMVSGDLWSHGKSFVDWSCDPETGEIDCKHLLLDDLTETDRSGDRDTVALWYLLNPPPLEPHPAPESPEDALECADCGGPCDPRELFCDACLERTDGE